MNASTREELTDKLGDMERRLAKRGRKGVKYAVPGHLLIERTDELADETLRRLMPENPSGRERLKKTGYVGSPATVASRILEKDEAGISYLILQCAPTVKTLESFREEVLPLL
jgi:alkanesulfonate monooxygenase SsuD/methylene tetrahydromethanopterin reductase-like flavin-dependent oxidoreductase (luciferase family)